MYNNNKNKTEENPNTASRNAFEDPPRGTSTDKTSELFEERKFYRDGAFKDFIFNKIIFGPKSVDFFTYKTLCELSNFFGLNDSFCINEMPFRIQSRTMAGQFSAHIWTSIASGFIISFPYVLYQFWY